jgi:hypothetical protein
LIIAVALLEIAYIVGWQYAYIAYHKQYVAFNLAFPEGLSSDKLRVDKLLEDDPKDELPVDEVDLPADEVDPPDEV